MPHRRPTHPSLGASTAFGRTGGGRAAVAVLVACLAGGLVSAGSAWAAGDGGDPAKAEELIRQANDLRRRNHDGQALPLYRKAYELARSARTAGQLGLAEMALGYWVAAESHLDEGLTEAHNPWVEKNRPVLENALRAAQTHVAELRVEGKPDGAEVLVNGSVVGTLPLQHPLRLSEGRVNLEVRAPGRRSMTTIVTLAGRASERINVALDRDDKDIAGPQVTPATPTRTMVVAPTPEPTPAGDGGARPARTNEPGGLGGDAGGGRPRPVDDELPAWRRVLPWALLGGAVVAGAIGVWQQVESQTAQSRFDSIAACGAGIANRGTDPRCAGYYDDFDVTRTRAYVGYGVAGVLGAAAITLFIVNAVSGPSAGTSASVEQVSRHQAFVGLAPGGAQVSYAFRF